jgi:DNA invertase Pin-like site-specific DNA recombinase
MERGVRFERPASLITDQKAPVTRLLKEGQSANEVAKTVGVNHSTIYRATATDEKRLAIELA